MLFKTAPGSRMARGNLRPACRGRAGMTLSQEMTPPLS